MHGGQEQQELCPPRWPGGVLWSLQTGRVGRLCPHGMRVPARGSAVCSAPGCRTPASPTRPQCGLLSSRPCPPPPAALPRHGAAVHGSPRVRGRVSMGLDASGQTCLPACPLPWLLWVGALGWRPACSAGWGSGGGACVTPSPSEVLAVITVGQGKFRPPSLRWLLVWQRGS